MSLPPIPDEAYDAGHETIGSAYEWGTSDEVIEAAYPIIAEAVLRWAAERMQNIYGDWVPTGTLRFLADEIKEARPMSTAREVAAQAKARFWGHEVRGVDYDEADAVLAALREAGYIPLDPTGGTV